MQRYDSSATLAGLPMTLRTGVLEGVARHARSYAEPRGFRMAAELEFTEWHMRARRHRVTRHAGIGGVARCTAVVVGLCRFAMVVTPHHAVVTRLHHLMTLETAIFTRAR